MGFLERIEPVIGLFRERRRRSWVTSDRGLVELRELAGEDLSSFVVELEAAARELGGLEWLEVNPFIRRAVFAFRSGSHTATELSEVVERAEKAVRLEGQPFGASRCEGDVEPGLQLMVELCGDLVGLVLGLVLLALPVSPLRSASTATFLLSLSRDIPRIRRRLDERLGHERAGLLLDLAVALAQGLAQRPMSSLVDVIHKGVLLREQRVRRRVWLEHERELHATPSMPPNSTPSLPSRPVPLPKGLIEEYGERAWLISLSGFLISFITTRSVERAVAALFGALPKPARFGREVFAAQLGVELASRGIVVLAPEVLRLLDRVDCLVVQGDLISPEKFVLGTVVSSALVDDRTARFRVRRLFDPEDPLAMQREDEWVLGPATLLDAAMTPELQTPLQRLTAQGELVAALAREGQVVALAEVRVVPQTGVEELISAAHAAEMRVVVASAEEAALEGLHADDVISDREGLHNGIRRLQREGRVVCLVASGRSAGLPLADCAIGLSRAGEPPPWGAHLICGDDLSDVRFILQACVAARSVVKQSVNIALGAATMGAVVSVGGLVPMTTARALTLVNTATLISMVNGARGSTQLKSKALPPPRDPTPWHALDARGVMSRLGSSEQGITRKEVARRRQPVEHETTPLAELGEAVTDELFNPFAPLLAAGAGLSALVGSTADAGVVAGVMALNAVVGGIQRFRTERAIRQLARTTQRSALVRRAGRLEEVDAGKLVAGDVVMLGAGDVVPADCRIVESESLEVDGSSLTGESLPVSKDAVPSFEPNVADRSSMLYEGTSIAAGRATAVVVAVGQRTEAQRGVASAKRDRGQGGVEKRLRSLMRLTGPVALVSGIGVVGGGLLRGRHLEDLVGSGVSLAVAAVPEGLPLLATAAQLAAAERLSRRGVLVRNVRSIEALGRVDVICLDKTGTVTKGKLELRVVSDGLRERRVGELDEGALRVLAAGLRATSDGLDPRVHGDPTDEALIHGAAMVRAGPELDCPGWRRTTELAFEAGRKYHAVVATTPSGSYLGVKGAPEVILPRCTTWLHHGGRSEVDEPTRQLLGAEAARLAQDGLRVLAVAEQAAGTSEPIDPGSLDRLAFRGFIAFADPVRPSAAAAIQGLRDAGVDVVMLTGDHPNTAAAIAAELGLARCGDVLTGAEIAEMSNEVLEARLRDVSVLARATPSQKVRVVRGLQRLGRVVAMAGDGANDAPAIRVANVGFAIGEGSTAAARGAADVVLTEEGIETLVDAVIEGRAMWGAVRDAVSVLIGGNLGEIGFTLSAGLVDGRPPLNARQLLLVNLLTDAAPAMAIVLRSPSDATLASLRDEGPEASLARPLTRAIATRAAVTAFGAGTAWAVGRLTGSAERAQTIGLAGLVGTQLGQTLLSGGANLPVLLTSIGSAAALVAVVQSPVVGRFFGCEPLGPLGWATAAGSSALATYMSVTVPRSFERLTDRFHRWIDRDQDEGRTETADDTCLEAAPVPEDPGPGALAV